MLPSVLFLGLYNGGRKGRGKIWNGLEEMILEDVIHLEEIRKSAPLFWPFFFCSCFPNGYLESEDIEITDYIQENDWLDLDWVHSFTKYYPGVFDDYDGYVKSPRTLLVKLNRNSNLSIEFHPGDTIFYLNGQEIGCTGPHFQLHGIAWDDLLQLTMGRPAEAFFALLPMAYLVSSQYHTAAQLIQERLSNLSFRGNQDEILLRCILADLQIDE